MKWRLTKQANKRGTARGSARDKRLRLAERAAREVERRTELEGEANRWSKEVGAGSQKPINWWKPLALGTWNVRALRAAISQEMVATDMASQRLAACALQEVAWEGEERRQVGDYVFYGGGAWRPEVVQGHNKGGRHRLVGGAAVGIHVRLEASVIRTVHRAGRVQLVMLWGAQGKRLVFGSLYTPSERSSDAAKEKDKE